MGLRGMIFKYALRKLAGQDKYGHRYAGFGPYGYPDYTYQRYRKYKAPKKSRGLLGMVKKLIKKLS